MSLKTPRSGDALRQRAEALLARAPEAAAAPGLNDLRELAQELAVYQAELELQNEELRETRAALQQARDRFAALYEHAPAGYIVLDAAGLVRQANTTWRTLLHSGDTDFRGRPFADFLAAEDAPVFRARFRAFFRNPAEKQILARVVRSDGSWFHARIEARPRTVGDPDSDEARAELMVIVSDVTELQQARARSERLNAVLRGVRSVNQLITQEEDRDRLLQRACDTLTSELSYGHAWVALLDEGGRTVTAVTGSGGGGRLPGLQPGCAVGEGPACLRRALATPGVVGQHDPSAEATAAPGVPVVPGWTGLCCQLSFGGRTYGVFAASVPEVFAGEVEERTLFDEVAGDLAFALHKIELSRRLADARRRHREIFEGSRDGFVMVDAAGRILDANRAYCALLGYTLTELRGLENVHVVTPARWHQWEAEEIWSRRLLKQGASGLFEKECLRKDGRIVPVEVQAYAVRDEAGRLDYVWSAVRDLSERQQREERIALLGRLLDEGPAAITIHDAGGRFLFANRQAVRLHGYDREAELLALSLDAVGVPGSGALPAGWKDRIAREGETRFEVAHHRRDGSTLPLEVLARPIEWQGRPALLSIAVDITERKQAETALRRRETLLQRIFEVLPVGLWLADQGGTILRGNPAGVRLWGAELQMPLAGWADFKAWRLPQREPVGAEDWALVRTIRDQVTVVDELLEIETADGRRKTILNYSAPVLDDRGTLEGAIMLNLDVTDRVTLEAQLRQAHKMESVGRLAGGVAHDFNNLVMGIQGYAELCRAGVAADHPVRPWIDEILREAKRSANLTRRLLAFARKQTIAPRVLDLNEAVEGMLRMLRRLIGEDVHLVWQPAANLWPVRVDPGQLDQILANLCVNARDAISGVGHITIETSNRTLDETCRAEHADARPGRFVVLTVSDDGCGMAPEVQAHLFEPFFTTKAVGEGTGLGLATVYGILQQNQGFVNVYTEPGRGTTFRIYLPRHEGGAESTSDSLPPGAVRGTGTILLVEDEAAIRITAAVFLQDAGFSVLTAEAPEVALSLSAGHAGRIDLLITDVVMPGMNGSDLARELRGGRPDLRVLYMSGYTANVIAHHGVLEEGVEFLEKPFSKDELIRKVAEVLRRDADRPGV